MKAGRASIGIFQKMRIENLRGAVRSDLEKLDSFTLETSKNHLIHNFLRNGRVKVNHSRHEGRPFSRNFSFFMQTAFQDCFNWLGPRGDKRPPGGRLT